MVSEKGLVSALAREESGLSAAGFQRAGAAMFERRASAEVHWRVVVYRDADQPQWLGRVWVGVFIPRLATVLPYQEPAGRYPGIHMDNLLHLAGRERGYWDVDYNGARPNRWRIMGRLSEDELEEAAARDLGGLLREAAMPWWEKMTDYRGVAAVLQEEAESLTPGPDAAVWAHAGLMWKLARQDALAEAAWRPRAHYDREDVAYIQQLRAKL